MEKLIRKWYVNQESVIGIPIRKCKSRNKLNYKNRNNYINKLQLKFENEMK